MHVDKTRKDGLGPEVYDSCIFRHLDGLLGARGRYLALFNYQRDVFQHFAADRVDEAACLYIDRLGLGDGAGCKHGG